MPSRVVEAALLLVLSISSTIYAFYTLQPYLIPQRAIRFEEIKDNIISFAVLLDKGYGKFTSKTNYFINEEEISLNLVISIEEFNEVSKVLEETWRYSSKIPISNIKTIIGEERGTTILRGDLLPYSQGSLSSLAYTSDGKARIILRPCINVENCSYYGFSCKFVRVYIPVLLVRISGSVKNKGFIAHNQEVNIYSRHVDNEPEIKYGKRLKMFLEILPKPPGSSLLDATLTEQFKPIELEENGVFFLQYIINEIIIEPD